MTPTKPPKARKCKACPSMFTPMRPMQRVCGPICALAVARKVNAKTERKADAGKRIERLTIPELIKKAQTAFNAFIRERDAQKTCICCGKPLGDGDVGGRFDCGHYRSVGSASHLRFNEANAHGQRKYCNRYGAGRAVDYRIGLIARVGLDTVEHLESDNAVHKWTREELIAIKTMYVRRLKQLRDAA